MPEYTSVPAVVQVSHWQSRILRIREHIPEIRVVTEAGCNHPSYPKTGRFRFRVSIHLKKRPRALLIPLVGRRPDNHQGSVGVDSNTKCSTSNENLGQ